MLRSAPSLLVRAHARCHAASNIVQMAGWVMLYYGSACLVQGFGCVEDSDGDWHYLITIGRSARCGGQSQRSRNWHVTLAIHAMLVAMASNDEFVPDDVEQLIDPSLRRPAPPRSTRRCAGQ